ncbi:MAG TPA: hypothetical protein VGO09_05145 [Flavisolibacter sp.]|nr:hypothetical protein [Flavisolibacter sp.]
MKFSFLIVLVCSSALIITACKKSDSNNTTTDPTLELTAQADDQSRFSNEVDAVANDANVALSNSSSINGGRIESVICDATMVIDSVSNPRTITITYNGTNCGGNRTRTGVVVLSLPAATQWKNAGAALSVKFTNLKITRVLDNKSITINGTKTMTNVSGGLLSNLASQQTITHTITSSGLTVTFDDGTQRVWQIARQRVFTYSNGIVVTESGTHTEGSVTNVAEWGTNRNGHAFTSAITEPVVVRQDCSFRIVSGKLEHKVSAITATATFGLNANGAPTTCPATGSSYYLKITWTVLGGTTKSIILPY